MQNFFRIKKGLTLRGEAGSTVSEIGDLAVNSTTSKLEFHNGSSASPVVSEAHSATLTNKTIDSDNNTISNIVNANIKAAAGIAYSKLSLSNSIVNADINASAAIAYSKLNLASSIVNADINASAAIAYSKLNLASSIVNADVASGAAIDFSKLASLTSGNILVGSVGNVATSVAMSGDATIVASGALTIANNAVSNAKLAQMAAHTFKGNNTGSTANASDLSATQLTAELNAFVGDSGSGGTKGLVPAPSAGDSTKFLKGDGTWATSSGGLSDWSINAQTGTTYTFALTDRISNGYIVTFGSASATTVTVPPNSSVAFPVGSQINCIQVGAGQVLVTPGSGVTVNSAFGYIAPTTQYSFFSLIKTATNVWELGYDIGPSFISATGGNSIATDGDYKVHTFTSSGNFVITSGTGTVDSLIIAGGGGGGSGTGGGGGAGGMLYDTARTMSPGTYAVVVGAGGSGAASNPAQATNGSDSTFNSLTAVGGGKGGTRDQAGNSGGSGGGAGNFSGTLFSGGSGTGGQGNSGGTNGAFASFYPGGGGGGAGAAGNNAPNSSTGGNGGAGSANSITGASVTYAGGGGGGSSGGSAGTGGGGGGGNGSGGAGATAGSTNTGGGGGGGYDNGANGGSGKVIIRYKFQ